MIIGGSIFLGLKLDEWWGTSPWMVLLGFLGGFALGFYYLFVEVFREREDPAGGPEEDDRESGAGE